jgi:ketosteroid isomerase-like protein
VSISAEQVRAEVGRFWGAFAAKSADVASYTFEFHASRVSGALGKVVEEDIQNGRATQVYVQQADGSLCILHEHLSLVAKT